MNIDSIKTYPAGSSAKYKHRGMRVPGYEERITDVCKNEKLNRGYYGGSFTGINMNRAAATVSSTAEPLLKDNWFDKLLKLCDKHTVIAQNLVALVLAATLRPLAIMSLPGKKNKEDKEYAAGHSISSGVIGFGFSSVVMYPLGQAVEKTKRNVTEISVAPLLDKDVEKMLKDEEAVVKGLKDKFGGETYYELIDNIRKNSDDVKGDLDKVNSYKNLKKQLKSIDKLKEYYGVDTLPELVEKLKEKYNISSLKDLENVPLFQKFKNIYKVENLAKLEQSHAFKMATKVLDMAPDVFIFGLAKAMLTVALIPPILKYGFGVEKSKKPAPEQNPAELAKAKENSSISVGLQKPEIAKFAGGLE